MRRFKLLLGIFAVTVLLGGCATATQTYDSSGKVAHVIRCGGLYQGWGNCYEKAGSICGASGYTIVEKNSAKKSASSGLFTGFTSSTESRSLVVTCND